MNPQRQMYYCFGCHAGGSAITFVMEMEHLDFIWKQSSCWPSRYTWRYRSSRTAGRTRKANHARRGFTKQTGNARDSFTRSSGKESAQILEYLHGRELSDSTIRVFGLGATPPQSDGATRAMRELGFTDDELVSAGISVRREGRVYDMFRQRAIFPIIDAQGRVLGFGGRALGDVKPKYLNTGDTPIFNKRLGVFARHLLKKQRGLKR